MQARTMKPLDEQDKLVRAKKRVDELKGFYIHFSIYLVINVFIMINVFANLDQGESFWQVSTFFTAIFWGIGVAFHAAHTFNINLFFGKKWEERQIEKYIKKDEEEAQKFGKWK